MRRLNAAWNLQFFLIDFKYHGAVINFSCASSFGLSRRRVADTARP